MNIEYGMTGPAVFQVQKNLLRFGFNPGNIDSDFGPGTEAAVLAFQRSHDLEPDGIVGPATQQALGGAPPVLANQDALKTIGLPGKPTPLPPPTRKLPVDPFRTVATVSRMMPAAPLSNIREYLPALLSNLDGAGLGDQIMFIMAVGTIAAETAGFKPIDEGISRYNSSPNGHPFDLYDNRRDLGNRGYPDGSNFRGRSFVQLTGRNNYETIDRELSMRGALVAQPWIANGADLAAAILARYLADRVDKIRAAFNIADWKTARRLVNGGSHGLDVFTKAVQAGLRERAKLIVKT